MMTFVLVFIYIQLHIYSRHNLLLSTTVYLILGVGLLIDVCDMG